MVSYLRKAEYGLDISFCILKMWCVLKNFGLGAKPRFRTYPLAFYNEKVVSPKNNLFFPSFFVSFEIPNFKCNGG